MFQKNQQLSAYVDEQRTSLMAESVNRGPNCFHALDHSDFNQRVSAISDIALHS
jgi:hypothetical protein